MSKESHTESAQAPRSGKGKKGAMTLAEKWGTEVIGIGYVVVPSVLLRGQARLHIGRDELAVLVHLLEHWWHPSEMPWPSKKVIAERLGVSTKTVQRALANMEKEGLLTRVPRFHKNGGGRTSNEYDLSPLLVRLKEIAQDMEQASKDAAAAKKAAERPGFKKRALKKP